MQHILFAFIILSALIPLIKFFNRLPKSVSKVFADFLNFITPLFNFVNAIGARGGAKVFTGKRLKSKTETVFSTLLNSVASIKESDWQKGMYYPTKWDGLFDEYMTMEKLFRYPTKHFKFHLKQLTF